MGDAGPVFGCRGGDLMLKDLCDFLLLSCVRSVISRLWFLIPSVLVLLGLN